MQAEMTKDLKGKEIKSINKFVKSSTLCKKKIKHLRYLSKENMILAFIVNKTDFTLNYKGHENARIIISGVLPEESTTAQASDNKKG